MSRFETTVAFRYLRSKRKEVFISIITVISVLSVAISVMVLDIVLAVMTGFETELKNKLLDANPHIVVRQLGGELQEWAELRKQLASEEKVLHAFPYTYNQALISTDRGAQGLIVRGVANEDGAKTRLDELLGHENASEALFANPPVSIVGPEGETREVNLPPLIIGAALSKRLGLAPGSLVTLLAPKMGVGPQGLTPRYQRFVVRDIYRSGLVEYEAGVAYTTISSAQRFFGLKKEVTGLELVVEDVMAAPALSTELARLVTGPYYFSDWTQRNQALWDAIKLEKRVYFIVLLLLVLVASFSVVSTLVMVVMEKGKDIAILKTMGASDRSVLSVFLLQGVVIGAVGTVLGSALGYLGCLALKQYGFPIDPTVFSMDTVPVRINAGNFALVAGSAFFITSLAGIYPAARAARLSPAAVLRYE